LFHKVLLVSVDKSTFQLFTRILLYKKQIILRILRPSVIYFFDYDFCLS